MTRPSVRVLRSSLACAIVVSLCACSAGSPSPLPSETIATPSQATTGSSTEPTTTPTQTPSPGPAQASLPIRGSARDSGDRILMASGPDGSLYVSIPRPGGSILTLLDETGRSRPGWPVVVKDSAVCGHLLPVDDGSVRTVCDATNLPQPELDAADVRAFAFDTAGRLQAGWPVQLRPGDARVVGDELRILSTQYLTDAVEPGKVSHEVWLQAVAANGTVRTGRHVPMVEGCCGEGWAIGPGGAAYARIPVEPDPSTLVPQATQLTAVDLEGVAAGWPLRVDGGASAPAFDGRGNVHVTVGPYNETMTRVEVIPPSGGSVASVSSRLPIGTAAWGELDGESMTRPLIGADGTAFVYSVYPDATVYAIHAPAVDDPASGPSGEVMPGWPYRPPTPLVRIGRRCEGYVDCVDPPAIPSLGPNNVIYLPLLARSESVGGSLMSVGVDGRVRSGWPVELTRPGSEVWSVVVGPDGTAYALAIERESADTSSATILAIAPDSTVLYSSTVVEPGA